KMPALRDFLKERTVAQVVAERSRSASRLPPMLRNMNFANSINFANNIPPSTQPTNLITFVLYWGYRLVPSGVQNDLITRAKFGGSI
ncbi:MAG: hypothetical protein AAGG51_19280, partial [Cyanobacteria bacterium P01_G01_bin.54]